ncbi:MAG TPA: YjjG family noncanonical pyrimidine nucleotidase [Bacteroidales bacterium]|jgi:putative hydrolase of the HAD superfamily|nr:YjjG family noncanonical pyrimidine nucleotidase [Bacteroidales bacterium]MDY0160453.1 YjjG family noncanonical pyrimidine nucleotidase [Bacteroidales bacterium]HXK80936.1 YjjG family noncanonical pyrimidine nucleotidase [Bacteroidales bacterium]
MKAYKNLFIDLDRTLWDFEANSEETFRELFNKYNLQLHFCDFNDFFVRYRKNNNYLWSQYRENLISKDKLKWLRFDLTFREVNLINKELAISFGNDYITISPEKVKLIPNTIEVLEYLHPKYHLYLVTNGFKEVQEKKLTNTGLNKYFKRIFTSEEIGFNKPHPEYFSYVLSETNASIIDSIVIGDDLEVDIKGANHHNLDTIWLNNNGNKASYKVSYEIKKLSEILNIL